MICTSYIEQCTAWSIHYTSMVCKMYIVKKWKSGVWEGSYGFGLYYGIRNQDFNIFCWVFFQPKFSNLKIFLHWVQRKNPSALLDMQFWKELRFTVQGGKKRMVCCSRQKYLSWRTSLLCIVGELAWGGSLAVAVGVGDMWHLRHNRFVLFFT